MKVFRVLRKVLGVAALLGLAISSPTASAAVTCSISVTPIVVVYDPTVATENITAGAATISCTRAIADPNTFAYTSPVNNGIHNAGAQNRVQLGANLYNYELYRLSPYINANRWQTNPLTSRLSGTINFGVALVASNSHTFFLRVPGSQPVVPAGTYTDTVTAEVRNSGGTTMGSTTFSVSVITTNSCQLSTPPGSINFTYTSFQGAISTASTNFSARCTSGLPYTLALDAISGTLLGLNYTLALSAPGATGTGVAQSFAINGSIAAGQVGNCATGSCNSSQGRTLTVTY
jgi:spore coat protein U-like protein